MGQLPAVQVQALLVRRREEREALQCQLQATIAAQQAAAEQLAQQAAREAAQPRPSYVHTPPVEPKAVNTQSRDWATNPVVGNVIGVGLFLLFGAFMLHGISSSSSYSPAESPSGPQATISVRYAAERTELRRSPGTGDNVIDEVQKGMRMAVHRLDGDWAQVTVTEPGGRTGWVVRSVLNEGE